MIKGDLGVDPGVVEIEARLSIVDHVDLQHNSLGVNALEELTAEELNAHYGEDEPKDQTHQQHIEDGRNGVHECVHHDPHALPPRNGSEWSEGAQRPQRSKDSQVLIFLDQQRENGDLIFFGGGGRVYGSKVGVGRIRNVLVR